MVASKCKNYLDFLERLLFLAIRQIIRDQEAQRLSTTSIVLHVQGDGPACLGTSAHMVELKSHQRLNESALAVRLVPYDENGGRVKRLAKLLSQGVKLVVRLVELLVPSYGEMEGAAVVVAGLWGADIRATIILLLVPFGRLGLSKLGIGRE